MYSTYDSNGDVLALNKRATGTESEVEHERSALTAGMYAPFYKVYNEELIPRDASEISQITADLQAAIDAKQERLDAIIAAQGVEGTSGYTIEQAMTFLNSKTDLTNFDSSATLGEVKSAIRTLFVNHKEVLRRIIIEILK